MDKNIKRLKDNAQELHDALALECSKDEAKRLGTLCEWKAIHREAKRIEKEARKVERGFFWIADNKSKIFKEIGCDLLWLIGLLLNIHFRVYLGKRILNNE